MSEESKPKVPGRYSLMQRTDPEASIANYMKSNNWQNWRGLSWDNREEAERVKTIFAKKYGYYQFMVVDRDEVKS